jgi:hypothetical protein
MRFASRKEKMDWLKATGGKIQEMEFNRRLAIVQKDFKKAYELLSAANFAKCAFKKVSRTLMH